MIKRILFNSAIAGLATRVSLATSKDAFVRINSVRFTNTMRSFADPTPLTFLPNICSLQTLGDQEYFPVNPECIAKHVFGPVSAAYDTATTTATYFYEQEAAVLPFRDVARADLWLWGEAPGTVQNMCIIDYEELTAGSLLEVVQSMYGTV